MQIHKDVIIAVIKPSGCQFRIDQYSLPKFHKIHKLKGLPKSLSSMRTSAHVFVNFFIGKKRKSLRLGLTTESGKMMCSDAMNQIMLVRYMLGIRQMSCSVNYTPIIP